MKAPDYNWGDLVYYGGLIIGGGIVYYTLLLLGVRNRLLTLIPAGLVGAGIGYLLEQAYRKRK